jgi:glycerol-3-phosphate acyltransferase PlsX
MKIVIDAMGGDYAPQTVVEGVIDALEKFDIQIALVGQENAINQELAKYGYSKERIEVVDAPDVIGMHEPAIVSIRAKKNSSISTGIRLLKKDGYDAFISAGNTGAVVASATINLGMLEGFERPAIGVVLPTLTGFTFLIDVGANSESKPMHLLQSAYMAEVYATEVLGLEKPSIGLLNIGEEAGKGGGFAKEAYKLLEEDVKNFSGNVEASELFTGKADCIVCDGFVGNVLIKVSQGLMESASTLLKREIKKSPIAMLGALLMKKKLQHVKKYADYSEYGGAPLLGVNGVVMISHGRTRYTIKNGAES